MAKKFQVFVSSTYTDLVEERQAVVEAILKAGHIPAGMELFAAGDSSQLETIKEWIAASDVYMLVVGNRYGSIEPTSGKSYIHVEYEHAVDLEKPHFVLVMDDAHEKAKAGPAEHADLLTDFKNVILSTKLCSFFQNADQLGSAVLQSLAEINRKYSNLAGWIRNDEVAGVGPLAAEIGHLREENSRLKEELADIRDGTPDERYNGCTYQELLKCLKETKVSHLIPPWDGSQLDAHSAFSALVLRAATEDCLQSEDELGRNVNFIRYVAPALIARKLIAIENGRVQITEVGQAFFRRMDREGDKPQYNVSY